MILIFCGINVMAEYGWRRFVLDGRRGFTDYSTVVSSSGWRSGFYTSGRVKGWRWLSSQPWPQPGVTIIGTSFLTIKKIHMLNLPIIVKL
ncbi:hypothetical protein Hanom_Chr12g01092811 [Helianthus anomalus]